MKRILGLGKSIPKNEFHVKENSGVSNLIKKTLKCDKVDLKLTGESLRNMKKSIPKYLSGLTIKYNKKQQTPLIFNLSEHIILDNDSEYTLEISKSS